MDTALSLAETATVERFERAQARIGRDFGYGETTEGLGITRAYLSDLSAYIKDQLSNLHQLKESDPQKSFLRVVSKLEPDVIALATLTSLLGSIAQDEVLLKTTKNLGASIASELWAQGLLANNAKLHARIARAAGKRSTRKHRAQAARSIAAKAGYRGTRWSERELIFAGGCLLDWALGALPDVFCTERGSREEVYPRIMADAVEKGLRCVEQVMRRNPVFLASHEVPKPWTGFRDGAYADRRSRFNTCFVRKAWDNTERRQIEAMRDGSMRAHIDGVNALQAVPYRINTRVLEVMKWCDEHSVAVEGLPASTPVELPPRLSDEEWANEDIRRAQRARINQIKEFNRGLVSKRVLFAQDVATAERLGGGAFYTPINCDWRGRVYPIPHFNFQRDDRVRALFLFDQGMPLGDDGLWWLKVHVANCGDFDKISKRPFEERVAWTDKNLARVRAVAECSIATTAYWTKADKPFLFLAACLELSQALEAGPEFVTTLPISFDGSCSGLQHLCAMTRAPEGSLVNLTAQGHPQDVYQTVAELVRTRIARELAPDSGAAPATADLAKLWLGYGITRKLVKRNVMTFCYSSKKHGMAKQHEVDLMRPLNLDVISGKLEQHPFEMEGDTFVRGNGTVGRKVGGVAARYLAAHVYAAIEEVIEKPAKAMAFLQKCARAMAHEGKALSWRTPTGFPWSNSYFETNDKHIALWLSDVSIKIKLNENTTTINKDHAANGVAPNFVHALDAAHLLLTVNACVAEGITSIATVHDSFGCLAPQARRFNEIIREQFVKMYEEHDVLAEVLECAKRDLTVHNKQRLPDLPTYGTLNLKEVLDAPFAFA